MAGAGAAHKWINAISTSGVPSATQPDYSDLTGAPALYNQTVQANGTSQTQRPIVNLISGANATVSCADNAGATRTDCTIAASASAGMTNPMTTLGDIIFENSTPAPARLAGNTTTTRKYLAQTGNGTISATPAWTQPAYSDLTGVPSTFTPSAHNLLSASHADTTVGTVARGDVITGQGASPTWTRLAKGAASQCLQMDGTATDVIWGACATGGSGIGTLNTLTAATQTFATGTAGTDFNISSATSTHTFNIPDAGAGARGLVTTGAQTLGGSKTFNSDMQIDATGSTTAAPRTVGVTNLGTGTAVRFQFGDAANAFQIGNARRMQIYSYWGLELLGGRQVVASSPPSFVVGGTTDPGVSVINTVAAVPALAVQGAPSQSGDLQDWQNSTPTVLAKVDASGNITAPTINGTTDLQINGASISSAMQTLTNKTLDAEGAGNLVTIPAKTYVAFASCPDGTSASLAVDAAAPETAGCSGTTTKIGVWQAADSEAVTFSLPLPADWTGNIDAELYFHSPDTSGQVIFNVALACVPADGSTSGDPAYNASSAFNTVTLAAPANASWKATVSNITKSGTTTCAPGGWMNVKVTRATDSAASRVNVRGVLMTLRRAM